MSMTARCGAVAAAVAAVAILLVAAVALAQANPFGVGGAPARPPAPSGLMGFMLVKQAEFYRALSGAIRAAKGDGSAVIGLLGLSFVYGIFHAAGPGHGKAVISSYLIANREAWRRGVVLSFASALLQAAVAVVIVGLAAALLGATRHAMCNVDRIIELVSYGLIALVGARLLWVKGRGLLDAIRSERRLPAPVGAAVTDRLDYPPHEHDHADHHHHRHREGACGHVHGPDPASLAGPAGWSRGLGAIVAVGMRPCSGAILVLVFALAQGLFWAGVAATFAMGLGTAITVTAIASLAVGARSVAGRLAIAQPGIGTLLLRCAEAGAAALILVFGLLLLAGYLVSEQIVGLC
jgi:nickel/cobalt transporter (NicO) family protein